MVPALVVLLSLSDVAPGPLRVKPVAECSADAECALSTFEGCCSGNCCPREPHGVSKRVNEAARCAVVDCAMRACDGERCAAARPMSDFVAACEAGRCVAKVKPTAGAQCRADNECVVVQMTPPGPCGPCGCCPTNVAMPAVDTVKLGRRDEPEPVVTPAPATPKPVPFGLSDGKPGPTCSPCQRPPPATAACRAGHCTVIAR